MTSPFELPLTSPLRPPLLGSLRDPVSSRPLVKSAWQIIQSILSPANEDYAYFDFTDASRRFVENTGPTPAANGGDAIGLVIDRSKQGDKTLREVIAAMPEKVMNGGFDSAANWAMTSTSTISGGKLHMNAEAAGGNVLQTGNGYVVGKLYAITYEVSNYVSGQHRVQIEAAVGQTRTGNGVFTDYIQCINANARTFIRSVSTLTCDVDNISIKEVPAHYASQATNTFKPTVQASGVKFDGSDDTLAMDWSLTGGGVEGFVMAQVDVQTVFSTFDPFIFGGQDTNPTRFALAVQYSTGLLRGMAGQGATFYGTSDIRGAQNIVVGMSAASGSMNLFVNDKIETTRPYAGSLYTGALTMGGLFNNTGTGTGILNRWGGGIKRLLASSKQVSLADYNKIRAAWLAQG